MKINRFLSVVLITCLLSPMIVLGVDTEIDYPNTGDDFSPCGKAMSFEEINQLPVPEATQVGEVSYISGGSCSDSVRQMKGVAESFPLEIVLVEKEGSKEVYIADVKVRITDAKHNDILNVITDGAFLLVNLPDGQYEVTAEYNLVSQNKRVSINHKKHKRVVFLWDNELNAEPVSE